MELWISYVLRLGVLTAAAIILLGLALFVLEGPSAGDPSSYHDLVAGGGHPIATSWRTIARGVGHARPSAIIQLGLLVLILTPLARVAMTVVLFVAQQDWVFVAITTVVLTILVLGLIGVGA